MTTAHSALTGSNLHEPKGAATATSGQVYVANGSGSGAWTSLDVTAFTGMIADFTTPVVPTGWLELDGSSISTTTYASLFAAMSISQTGSRTNGSAVVTGLTTTNMRAGYYVFGTGIVSGTTILTVDSSTQITMSATASSSGTSTVYVSPWLVASGAITLPDTKTAGRFRRSRSATLHIGVAQADQNSAHTHTVTSTGTSGAGGSDIFTTSDSGGHSHTGTVDSSVAHTHTYSGNTAGEASHTHTGTTDSGGVDHTHSAVGNTGVVTTGSALGGQSTGYAGTANTGTASAYAHTHTFTTGVGSSHLHAYSGTVASDGVHTHTFGTSSTTNHTHTVTTSNHTHTLSVTGTTSSTGSSEARPTTLVVMTCVKT